jgi:hypothetical protein
MCKKSFFIASADHVPKSIARITQFTLTLQKSRMPQVQGGEGEAVVCYREPLTTPELGYSSWGGSSTSAFLKGKEHDKLNGLPWNSPLVSSRNSWELN